MPYFFISDLAFYTVLAYLGLIHDTWTSLRVIACSVEN